MLRWTANQSHSQVRTCMEAEVTRIRAQGVQLQAQAQNARQTQSRGQQRRHSHHAQLASGMHGWKTSRQICPVSRATTTRRHLFLLKSSEYFVSLSSPALVHTTPSTLAAPGCAVPSAADAHRGVMSTANGAPKKQWESCCMNFNGFVVCCQCPLFERSGTSTRISVPTLSVHENPAFAKRFCSDCCATSNKRSDT